MTDVVHVGAYGAPAAVGDMPMNGKICVITGATSGIGRATVLGLAKLGAKVVIVARSSSKAAMVVSEISEIAGALPAEVVLADLTEMKEVLRASEEIRTRFAHVDVLINNAGGMFDTHHVSSEGIEDTYALNHLAGFALTLSLRPALRKAPHPRVVIVSSNLQKAAYVRDFSSLLAPRYEWSRIYAQTKLRNMIFAKTLSARWKDDGITVNSLHPGVVDTGLMSGWDNRFMKAFFGAVQRFFITPEKGALTSIFLASSASVSTVTGTFFKKRTPQAHNPVADDVNIQNQLWEESLSYLRKAGIEKL